MMFLRCCRFEDGSVKVGEIFSLDKSTKGQILKRIGALIKPVAHPLQC